MVHCDTSRELKDDVLGAIKGPLDERDVPVGVAVLLAVRWPWQHQAACSRGSFRCSRQEESVGSLPVVSEALQHHRVGVRGKHFSGDVMENVDKASNFLLRAATAA